MNPRFPAEWESQDGVLMAWPHGATDWSENLDQVQQVVANIITAITRFERVLLIVPERAGAMAKLEQHGVDLAQVTMLEIPFNDTWTRDYGPLTVIFNDRPVLLDCMFNGWGLKFSADQDNLVTRHLVGQEALVAPLKTIGLVLEGGSVETDGLGTILTTTTCLLSPNRNPQLDQSEVEQGMSSLLGARRVLWLRHGALAGDDTDSHIDTLARFAPDNTIIYQQCDDGRDEHYGDLKQMEQELQAFRAPDGSPYRLLPLPWPKARFDADAHRLPATYANFLVINGAVLVPCYDDPEKDQQAIDVIAKGFPGREVIGIQCLPLLNQHGSLHCMTMQLPVGVLP